MSRATQKLIMEAEFQTHLEDGWRCLGVLSDGRIVIERDESAARGFVDSVRRIVERSEIEAYPQRQMEACNFPNCTGVTVWKIHRGETEIMAVPGGDFILCGLAW